MGDNKTYSYCHLLHGFLEDARQCRELLHDGLSHAGVAGIIRMKTVGIRFVKHLRTSIVKREETGKGVEVDYRNCLDIACFLDSFHVFIEEDATRILVYLIWLDVLVTTGKESTMHRSHHHDLLGRIHLLQLRHGDVDAAFQCILVHAEVAVAALYHFAWLVAGYSHAVESRRVPFAYRHTVVVIVGTHKDEDGIEIIAMLFLE